MCPYHLRQLTWMRLRLRTVFCSARSDSIGCRVIANLKADRCDLHVGYGRQAQSARGYGEKDEQNRLKCWALMSCSRLLLINMLCDLCYVLTSSLVILDLLVRASTDLQSVFIIELAAWRQDLFITDTTGSVRSCGHFWRQQITSHLLPHCATCTPNVWLTNTFMLQRCI